MKYSFIFPAIFIFLFACSTDEKSESAGDNFEEVELIEESEEFENGIDSEADYVNTKLLSVRVGLYGEPGVMVLNHYEAFEGEIKVEGYYWYNKHQKNLDLDGFYDVEEGRYYLEEFYKGKRSGYMEFSLDGEDETAFWAVSMDQHEERQEFSCELLEEGHPDDLTIDVSHEKYEFEHTITIYNGETDDEEEGLNEMQVSFINDDYLAFKIFVIGRNAHMGDIGGVARIDGDKAYYDNQGKEEWDVCLLTFDLDSDQITVHEEECSGYHGMNVYFDCTFERVE